MKKVYFLSFLLLLIGKSVLCAPLSGTYTIGGTAPNYATFNLAVAALISNGVSGPVIFSVRPGTYTEQITITSITGASGSNKITFQSSTGKSGDVILTYGATGTNNNWVVNLSGCSYIIFNEMTLQATGATYSNVVYMDNSASDDTVKNSTITAPSTTTSTTNQVLINMCADGTNCNYNGAYNDTLYNGSYGIYSNFSYYGGVSYNFALYVENNVFINQYAYGLYNFRALNCTIKYNTMTSNSASSSYYGIWVGIAFGDSIGCNKIINCPGNGIWYDNGEPHIFNNFVEIVGTGINYGITFTDMNENGTTPEITYNTVLVLNTNSNSSAFYIPTGYDQPVNYMHDNAFINRGGGYAVNIVETGEVSNPNGWGIHAVFDYDDLYTTGTYIGNWGGTNCTTLANWQTTISSCACGGDSHSMNINPGFVSNTDLHLTADDLRYGTPDIEVGYDIDNQARNAVTPDIGADEFTGISNVGQFTASQTTVCAGGTVNFTDQTTANPSKWSWTFTGGTPDTSTAENPTITYNTTGTYNVQLIVTNSVGTDTLLKSGYITVEAAAVAGNIRATPDTVCSGSSVQLSATGNTGNLQWQSSSTNSNFQNIGGATGSPYTVPSATASFYFRVIAANGSCTDTSTSKLVTVNPAPVAGTIGASPDTVCSGSTVQLSAAGSTGNLQWQSSSTNSNFQNISGATGNPYAVPSAVSSFYFRLVTTTGSCTDTSNSKLVTVNPLPVAGTIGASPDTVCSGSSVQLSASGSTGTLQWQSSSANGNFQNIGGATGASYTVPSASASFYFRAVATNGNCSDTSGSELVTVNPLPTPAPVVSTADSIICSSDSTLITLNSIYSSYLWNNGATANQIYANAAGGYWVTVTNIYGCPAVSNQVNISVLPVPSVSLEVNGDTLSSLNAVAYQWYKGDSAITGAINFFYVVQQTGYYSVQITDTSGCKTQSAEQYILITGIENLGNNAGFGVYPNPFSNSLFIQKSSAELPWAAIEIYDVLGRIVMSEPGAKPISNTLELDVSALPAGLYYLKITAGETEQVYKLVKQ